jgi:hypothetical protein
MRNRLTKQAMGKDDSPTTMHVEVKNPDVSKYESGDPSAWGEGAHGDTPWKSEKREETGHAKMKGAGSNVYANAVKEAQELEAKALRCLKMAETMLGNDAPVDVLEKQAVDFMTMSNKSVLATLRRMREFEENISEARVAKIVDAVLEVMAEEEQTVEASEEEVVEAALEVVAEEMKEEEKEEEKKEEKKEASEEDLVSKVTAAVLAALSNVSAKEEMKEEKEEDKKEAAKDCDTKEAEKEEKKEEEMKEAKKEEEKEEEMKEAKKEEEKEEEMKEAEEHKEEEKEEKKEASAEITFEEGSDVLASDEDAALLSQLFSTKEADEEGTEKEAKIKTLKNVTASTSSSEIDQLASLWAKDL